MPHPAPRKEAANAAAVSGIGALELRWMADHERYNYSRPVRSFRRRSAHRPARGGTRDCLHLLLAAGTAVGRRQLHGNSRVSRDPVILSGEFASLREANSQSKDLYSSPQSLTALAL